MVIRRLMVAFVLVTAGVVALPSAGSTIEVVAGSTWYSDGIKHKSGPPGTVVTAYAAGGAIQGVPYKLVLALDSDLIGGQCVTTVQELNPNAVFAGPSGVIGRVKGTVLPTTPKGTYILCFKDSMFQSTNTGGATFTVE